MIRGKAAAAVMGAAALLLLLTGCGGSPDGAAPSAPASVERAPTPAVEVPVTAATPAPARPVVPPVRLVAAAVGVDVPVVPVGVEGDGLMQLPENPAVGGWYRFGPDPARGAGNVVISAHVDAPGFPIGPFSRIRDLPVGAEIDVTDAAGATHRYTVSSVTSYAKPDLPVERVFARDGAETLVLITCGGAFDASTGRYADNVVAIATATG